MPSPWVILHERVANWSRRLRPRFPGGSIRWSETRSARSLASVAARSPCPIVVVGLEPESVRGLLDLAEALEFAPDALALVLDPLDRAEVAEAAREVGATLCLSGPVVPPEVERLLRLWLPIAGRRQDREGWSEAAEPEPEPWDDPAFFTRTSPIDPSP